MLFCLYFFNCISIIKLIPTLANWKLYVGTFVRGFVMGFHVYKFVARKEIIIF